ncbi:MAG: universal stress protein E [Chlamydiales bacterium]|jgi:universal stress protein E
MYDFKEILVGLDLLPRGKALTPGSQKALDQAIWLAKRSGGRLTLIHSAWSDTYVDPISGGAQVVHEGLSTAGASTLAASEVYAREQGVSAESRVVDERLWVAMIHAVLRGNGDCVVVGKRNQEEGSGRRLGSVATKLLRKCPCPVWVVRPEHDLVHRLVLAATDLTPVGDEAVHAAAYVASSGECDLHVVHAYQIPLELQMESANLTEDEYTDRVDKIRKAGQARIEACLEGIDLGFEPHVHVRRNNPSIAIREAVEHLHPDLLVMGTLSRSGIPGLLVGNTAERLLDRVDCSILAIKPRDFVSPIPLPD